MAEKSGVNWKKIKTEYITTSISQRKIAEKYEIPFPTLRDRCVNEKWYEKKKAHHDKVVTNAVSRIAEKQTDLLVEEFETACRFVNLLKNSLDEKKNYDEVMVDFKSGILKTGRIDTKAILNATNALQRLIDIKRVCTDHQTINEKQRHEIELEKLALERKKAEKDSNDDKEIRIVIDGNSSEIKEWGN